MPYRTRCRSCAELVTRNEELRRKDHIIAALTERIPALEPASEPRESSVAASERKDESRPPAASEPAEEERCPWWKR